MKMSDKNHLEEAVHDGFDSLVESLSDRNELGSIIHDGLHDLSEQIGSKSDVSQVSSLPYFYLLNNPLPRIRHSVLSVLSVRDRKYGPPISQ